MKKLQTTSVIAVLLSASALVTACSSDGETQTPVNSAGASATSNEGGAAGNPTNTTGASQGGAAGMAGAMSGTGGTTNGASGGAGGMSTGAGGVDSSSGMGGATGAGSSGGAEGSSGGAGASAAGGSSGGAEDSMGGAGGSDSLGGAGTMGTGGSDGEGGAGGEAGAGNDGESGIVRSPGCDAGGEPLSEGEHRFNLDGRSRHYIVRLPQNYDASRAWPLVMALHYNGGNSGVWDVTSGANNVRGPLGDKAVIIIPEAIEGQWNRNIEEELPYFEQLLTDAKEQLCLDESAIFSMGFSGGGSFSGVLGCRRTDIRAFASGGMIMYFDPADCVGKPAAWMTLSDGDEGDERRPQFVDWYAEYNGCDAYDHNEFDCHEYTGCAEDTPAMFCRYRGGHDWPDFGVESAWEFFSRFVETE